MSIKTAIFSRWYAPRVMHRLPGRLRIGVPLLRRVPPQDRSLTDQLEPLFLLPEGIESVDVGFLTGNMLVRFDAGVLSEQQVMNWTSVLWRLISEHWDRLAALPVKRVGTVVARVRQVLAAALREDPALRQAIVIPPHVWD
jgi:hypothetical protein